MREITTEAELDALPVGSVVLDQYGEASQRGARGDWVGTSPEGDARAWVAPWTVLHDPSAPVREDGEVEGLRREAADLTEQRNGADQSARYWQHEALTARAEVAALRAGIAEKAKGYRETLDAMHEAVAAREPHDFGADDLTRYAAYAAAWEAAERMAAAPAPEAAHAFLRGE